MNPAPVVKPGGILAVDYYTPTTAADGSWYGALAATLAVGLAAGFFLRKLVV